MGKTAEGDDFQTKHYSEGESLEHFHKERSLLKWPLSN